MFGYQDVESNRDCTYCKYSDVFSMGCLLFEIWTGDYLLRYSCNFEKNKEREIKEYIKALQDGRISEISRLVYPYDGATRTKLPVRIRNACPRWLVLLSSMTAVQRKDRETAEYYTQCGAIKMMRSRLEEMHCKLENGKILFVRQLTRSVVLL